MTTQKQKNENITSTSEDVLSLALGTKDPPGRVRGVGKYVTHTQYFHKPRRSSKGKILEHEVDTQEKARMVARIKELEEEFLKHKNNSHKSKSDGSEDIKEENVTRKDEKEENVTTKEEKEEKEENVTIKGEKVKVCMT